MDECYEFTLLFRFVFLNIERGDVRCFVVGFATLLLYKHGGYPVFLLWNGVFSSFCLHFLGALG